MEYFSAVTEWITLIFFPLRVILYSSQKNYKVWFYMWHIFPQSVPNWVVRIRTPSPSSSFYFFLSRIFGCMFAQFRRGHKCDRPLYDLLCECVQYLWACTHQNSKWIHIVWFVWCASFSLTHADSLLFHSSYTHFSCSCTLYSRSTQSHNDYYDTLYRNCVDTKMKLNACTRKHTLAHAHAHVCPHWVHTYYKLTTHNKKFVVSYRFVRLRWDCRHHNGTRHVYMCARRHYAIVSLAHTHTNMCVLWCDV